VVGDRIIQFEKQPVSDSRSLNNAVSRLRPGDTVSIAYIRDGNESTVQIKLAAQPNTIVSELSADLQRSSSNLTNPQTETTNKPESKNDSKEDVDGSKKSEQESDQSKTEEELKRGRWTGELAQFEHSYWAYVPEDYEPSQSFGLMVWIHPNGDVMEAAIQKQWKSICDRRRMIIIGPKADDVKRWVPGEAQFVKGLVNHIRERYSIDPSRIFLHTQGNGSPFACLLLSTQRDVFRGLALSGAPFVGRISEQEPETRQQIHFVCSESDKALPGIRSATDALRKLKISTTLTTVKVSSESYLQEPEIEQLARWADCLDRI